MDSFTPLFLGMPFSDFGSKFRGNTAIASLMNDLALPPDTRDDRLICRLGGGNPASIDAVSERFRKALLEVAECPDRFAETYGSYASPQGHSRFIDALVRLLNDRFDWQLEAENISLTNGSQNAFFMLFNLLAGDAHDGFRQIFLPMAPEYIGYKDVSVGKPIFASRQPDIELIGDHRFKYRVDFPDRLADNISAVCLSRPTNPTGNVITDNELDRLRNLAADAGKPLIIDNAYGAPFPDIIHVDAKLQWQPGTVLCMSLSKLGLPAARTGIVIADKALISALSEMNAVMNLASTSVTAGMLEPLFDSGEILTLCQQHIRPFYASRVALASDLFEQHFADLPVRMHQPEGSIFLWLWFKGLPGGSQALYEALKQRGVIVVAGQHFFPGIDPAWEHTQECLRVSIASDERELEVGLKRIAECTREFYAPQS